MTAAPQTAAALINALTNIRVIKSKLAATGGALTNTVFSTQGPIPDTKLDNARGAIGLEFASLVQNIRAIKTTDPICKAHPDIHYKLKDQIARRNWLVQSRARSLLCSRNKDRNMYLTRTAAYAYRRDDETGARLIPGCWIARWPLPQIMRAATLFANSIAAAPFETRGPNILHCIIWRALHQRRPSRR
ncbi:hypothetical protein A0H81_11286 [Grifola frondosa]|uniref:Uncharacterized protein n=1 Tax=Grifola frondosa TaxID=5627 RepID=A0A1C7LX13_GRIFR|nr:hypothetical protein A0H81_11286 [Grifola frondosa]